MALPTEPQQFQYISCYCLSTSAPFFVRVIFHFNTSHVTVYHRVYRSNSCLFHISIHLMLLFIILFEIVLIAILNFNTSHVTVYHAMSDEAILKCIFQYISCYCLSLPPHFALRFVSAFQYISCYCLSTTLRCFHSPYCISIHLMLLFIK